ncbi:hypothetical protein JYU34_006787 [Plutella xylostella]|uniref:Lipase n=1 Tax=Plutella xylostella TaxID=51655 RepID=A0ABQ7QSU1_PLUXY|nr:hypothetical protein JYU34_006787 [Plutella xylostella]
MIRIINTENSLTRQVVVVVFISMALSSFCLEDSSPRLISDNTFENFTEIVTKEGYKAEQHTVITRDGYIITFFRMYNETFKERNCTPVFVFHGVQMSCDSFLDLGKASLLYTLANAGYDVWAGNARGNYYARHHVTLNPDYDREFWNFTTDEIGGYDVPAQLDHVLLITGHSKVSIIAFSQGAECVCITLCELPEYNKKVAIYFALAPTVRLLHSTSLFFRLLVEGLVGVDVLAPKFKTFVGEILPRGGSVQSLLELVCGLRGTLGVPQEACGDFIYLLDSYHPGSMTPDIIKRLYIHFPGGTSFKLFIKFGQSTLSLYFQKFDYGEDNIKIYGTEYPPQYIIPNLNCYIVVFHGPNDNILNKTDLLWFTNQLPNLVEYIVVNSTLFNHFDHMYGKDTPDLVFPTILRYLSNYSECYGKG